MTNQLNVRVAVVGAGAVGCYFGGMLARAGAQVTLLRRPKPGAAPSSSIAPVHIDSINFQESIPVHWAHSPEAVRDAQLVLFCVKTIDNESAAQHIAPHLQPGAIVVSLQNGVDNVQQIRAASGIDVVPAVVYVAAAMTAPDRVKHSGRGELVIGELSGKVGGPGESESRVQRVCAWFEHAGVKCVASDSIETALWTKLMMNCAGNAITALGRANYGQVAKHEHARRVIADVVNECVAVARAAGIPIPENDYVAYGVSLAASLGEATSSTAQDIAKGKRTEIDSLNGFVAHRGAALGVPTPVNSTLHALVKLLEEAEFRK